MSTPNARGIEITEQTTIFELTEAHPETVQVLVDKGFARMRDPERRRTQGKSLTLAAAAQLGKVELPELLARLQQTVAEASSSDYDVTLGEAQQLTIHPPGDVRIAGLLPCPVRIPILEGITTAARTLWQSQKLKLGWSLQAASVGADALGPELAGITEADQLPDIFISAGFEVFFEKRFFGRFLDGDTFVDIMPEQTNNDFATLGLRDPEHRFSFLGVVPSVFVVNKKLLGELPVPQSWADLLHPSLAGQVALPVGDFDLFNALLLTLRKNFGNEAIAALARNTLVSLHPSQAVGRFAAKRQQQPAVSVVPYFFSRMTLSSPVLQTVWPQDGSVLSPIFALVKRNAIERAAPLVEFLRSTGLHEVLAHKGLFPSLHPEVTNELPEHAPSQWLGWEAIAERDLAEQIAEVREIYQPERFQRA